MSDPGQGRVLRSHSRVLRDVQDSISVAPRKPRIVADQFCVQGSARRLFTSPSTSASPSSSHPLNDGGSDGVDLDEVEDTSATPRALPATAESSVFEHFIPNPELFRDAAGIAAGVAASGAACVASFLPEFGQSFDPPVVVRSRDPVQGPASHPPIIPPNPLMATRLPPSKYLKTDSVPAFDGSPQALDGFDVSIQSKLELYNFPLFYGGTVRGDPKGEYEYVSAADPEGVSNYVLGKRLCAGLCGRLEKSALHWWQSYVRDGKVKPNCWCKHADCPDRVRGSVPRTIAEVSLYDLLHDHFSTDMDAQKAELELERFLWKPFRKDYMDVVVFRDHVEWLLWRAGIAGNTRTF